MKKLLPIGAILILAFVAFQFITPKEEVNLKTTINDVNLAKLPKKTKKTPEQRALFTEERARYEYELQVNPATGLIPQDEKELEFKNAKKAKTRLEGGDNLRAPDASFINRGPTNLGGRTRAFVPHIGNSNIIIAGGVSSGIFKSIDGGATWVKKSNNNEIHNVTSIAQDPTTPATWYYSTGEGLGNSASASGAFYRGQGIWMSIDTGETWTQIANTDTPHEQFNNSFDYINKLAVHPITGALFAACAGEIKRLKSGSWIDELVNSSLSSSFYTDILFTSGGRAYVSFSGNQDAAREGVWTSATGIGGWSRINETSPGVFAFTPAGRVVLGLAPSNEDKVYVLYVNGVSSSCAGVAASEADLFMWDQSITTWTDYSSKLPNESGCSDGNDPFAVQGGYDLVVSVKPDNEDFVVVGGTNAYKIANITVDVTFTRIGGYAGPTGYAQYTNHHPDVHALVFNPFNNNQLFSGTDGGVHKTLDINANPVVWTSLNNNYQTQQFYHVTIDPLSGSDIVTGGLQDNGTNYGGTGLGQPDLTTQSNYFGGDGVAVAISRDDPLCLRLFQGSQSGTFYRLDNGCGGYVNIEPSGSSSQFVTYFHLDPVNNNALFYAGLGVLYRTNDANNVTSTVGIGATDWTNMGTPTGIGSITRFGTPWETYNPATSYLLIGGSSGKVLRLDDPQNAASAASAVDITPGGATGTVTGLAVHPSNRDIVLLTYSNYGVTNIYITSNATSATPIWSNAENTTLASHSIRSAAITEVLGETMYLVGTARGLYSSTDPLTIDWSRESQNLIGYALVSSMAYRPADNKLLIGTHGNGMYEATITQVLGLEDNDVSKSIILYPNPVKDRLNLNMPAELSTNASFSISNILGQKIMSGKLENNQVIVDQLNTGIYFLQINANGMKGVKRFIKE